MTHCERCGHELGSHAPDGACSHPVGFGKGACPCDNYLRAVVPLPDLVATALHASPGRDATGSFYSPAQARLVGRLAEALLEKVTPVGSISATELLEGWCDAAAVGESRSYSVSRSHDGSCNVGLLTSQTIRQHDELAHVPGVTSYQFTHTSLQGPRDAAAKAIMKAGQSGFGS